MKPTGCRPKWFSASSHTCHRSHQSFSKRVVASALHLINDFKTFSFFKSFPLHNRTRLRANHCIQVITSLQSGRISVNMPAKIEDLEDEIPTSINPYKVLGVEKSATADDIKSAYRKLALKHHPGVCRHASLTHTSHDCSHE